MTIQVAIGIMGQLSPNKVAVQTANATHSADRLILRVCVGGLRRLNKKLFETNASRRIFFELKTGSFSRTTKTIAVSNNKQSSRPTSFMSGNPAISNGDALGNTWNETFSLASSKRECAPLVISAFEDRARRGSIASLAVKSKVEFS